MFRCSLSLGLDVAWRGGRVNRGRVVAGAAASRLPSTGDRAACLQFQASALRCTLIIIGTLSQAWEYLQANITLILQPPGGSDETPP
jgi:hypothetical protein